MFDLYNAQRTNFEPSVPRLAGKAGQQRQTFMRSANRGKRATGASNFVDASNNNQEMLLKLAKFKASGVV